MTCERGEFIAWRRGGRAERARESGIETSSSPARDGGDRTPGGHGELDTPNADSHECADLEQLQANGAHATDGVNIAHTTNECQ
jgi:hypothetical protein